MDVKDIEQQLVKNEFAAVLKRMETGEFKRRAERLALGGELGLKVCELANSGVILALKTFFKRVAYIGLLLMFYLVRVIFFIPRRLVVLFGILSVPWVFYVIYSAVSGFEDGYMFSTALSFEAVFSDLLCSKWNAMIAVSMLFMLAVCPTVVKLHDEDGFFGIFYFLAGIFGLGFFVCSQPDAVHFWASFLLVLFWLGVTLLLFFFGPTEEDMSSIPAVKKLTELKLQVF